MLTPFLSSAAAQSDAEKAGELFGSVLVLLFLLLGIIKCFRIATRKTTSTLCVLSLALVLIGFFISSLSRGFLKELPLGEPLGSLLTGLFGILIMLLLLGALVLAIVGLSLYRTPREEPYVQGKSQAIWALVLCLIPVGFVIAGAIIAVTSPSTGASSVNAAGNSVIENTDLNFRMEFPGKPWTQMDPKAINEEATFIFRKRFPEAMYMLVAERAGLDSGIDTNYLVEISKSNLKGSQANLEFFDMPGQTINEIEYAIFQTRATNLPGANTPIWYEHRVAMKNGYAYQLIAMLIKDDREAVGQIAEQLTKEFSQIDPENVLHSIGVPVQPFRDEEAGISIDLSTSGWNLFDDQETEFPEAIFAASATIDRYTGVNSVYLGDLRPAPDRLAAGFLGAGFNFSHPADTRDRREITQGIASGIELVASREHEGQDYIYVFRSLSHDDTGWFLSSWAANNSPEVADELRAVLDAYEVFEPTGPEKMPSPPILESHSSILNQTGISYYKADNHKEAIRYFEEAFEREPKEIQYLRNSIDSHMGSLQFEKAISRMESEPELLEKDLDLLLYKAQCHESLEEFEEARDTYKKLFEKDYSNEDTLLDYVNVLVDLEQREEGILVLDSFLQKYPDASHSVPRWKASLLRQLERYDESIEILTKLQEESPSDFQIVTSLIRTQIDAGNFSESLDSIENLISEGTQSHTVYLLKGRAKLGLKSYREAKEAFEKADDVSPGDPTVADYLEHTSTLLGKSNNNLIKSPIEEVPLPSEIAELSEELRSRHRDDLETDYGIIHLQRATGYFFEKGKPQKTTYRREILITDSNGLDEYSTLQFAFDPAFESLYVNEVKVADESGDVVARGNPEDFFILDDNNDGLADTNKIVHIPVPGLKVGYTVSYTVTREDFATSDEFDFFSLPMGTSSPTAGAIVYLLAETDSFRALSSNDVKERPVEGGTAYYTDRPPIRYYESSQPWAESFHPWLSVGSSNTAWDKEVKDYLARLRPVMEKDASLAAEKAKEIVEGATSDKEKIEKVFDYVSSSLTYQGIEFGPRGQIPDQFSTILKNRYGDCKDHSLIIVKLLREIGIEAHLALVSYKGPVKEDLPSLDQFDHMIAYIEGYPGSPFFDGTSDHFPAGQLAPSSFLFEKALILDEKNPRFEEIKPTEETRNQFRSKRTAKVDPENPVHLIVEETLVLEGFPATWFRNSFHDWRARDYAKELTRQLSNDGAPTVLEVTVQNLKNRRLPLEISMKYRLRDRLWEQGENRMIEPPAVWESYFLQKASLGERHNPFEILIPSEFESTLTLTLPEEGLKIENNSLKHFSAKQEGELVDWNFDVSSSSETKISIHSTYQRRTGTHPADDYETYIQSSNFGVENWNRAIVMTANSAE